MFSRHRIMAKFIAAMLVTLAATTAAPQQSTPSPVYNIELIVFRVGGGAGAEAAGGTSLRVPLGGGDAGEAGAAAQVGRFVGSIPAAQFQLGEIEAKLRSSQYTPIAHVAWSQTASGWGSRAGFSLARLGATVPGLNGMVYLERGTYLHLGMAMRYAGAELSEIRRVQFYKKNYYDSPAFGVIALVTPAQGARPAGR